MLGELLKLATTAIAYRAAEQGRRFPIAAAYFLVAAILSSAAIGCGGAALWIYLTPRLGPAGAPLALAVALLIVGLIFVAVGWKVLHPKASAPGLPAFPVEAALGQARHLFQENKASVLLAAALAGLIFAAGRRGS